MAGFPNWETALLHSLGAPPTAENLRFLSAWQRAEGGSASFNPLNTTQHWQGASSYNSVGVRNYPSAQVGLQATAHTLVDPRYQQIVGGLRSGRASAVQLAHSLARSPWGTGSGVLKVLGAGGGGSSEPVQTGLSVSAGAPAPAPNAQPARAALAQNLIANIGAIGQHQTPDMTQTLALVGALHQGQQAPAGKSTFPTPEIQAGLAPSRGGQTYKTLVPLAGKFGLTVTSTTSGNHVKGSYHYQGRAVDFSGDPAHEAALQRFALAHAKQFVEMFYTGPGAAPYFIKNGQVIPVSQLDSSVAAHHHDHVHLAR